MIKRLVEKIYYRIFPDRVDEHIYAPVVKEEHYRPEKIMTEYRVPPELIGNDELPLEWIKEHLAVQLVDDIKEHMTIECCDDPVSSGRLYRGYIRFLREAKR